MGQDDLVGASQLQAWIADPDSVLREDLSMGLLETLEIVTRAVGGSPLHQFLLVSAWPAVTGKAACLLCLVPQQPSIVANEPT